MTTITFVIVSFVIISIFIKTFCHDKRGISSISIHHATILEYLSLHSGGWGDAYEQ